MDNIKNQSVIEYDYQIDPNEPAQSTSVDSNITETDLVLGSLNMVKTVDKEYATIGDILTYNIMIANNGNILVSNIQFQDMVPTGATFVTGSVVVNGTPQPTYNPNTGFNLGSLIILGSVEVEFEVEVTSLPSPNTLSNQATTTFNYLVIVPIGGNASSNTVVTTVNVTELSVVKSASVTAVAPGDTLTYTIVITNEGNIPATNVEFLDTIAPELTFITGSVTVNGTPEPTFNPNTGFNLGTIIPNGVVTVEFDTTVN